jgi:hypothetical protein
MSKKKHYNMTLKAILRQFIDISMLIVPKNSKLK